MRWEHVTEAQNRQRSRENTNRQHFAEAPHAVRSGRRENRVLREEREILSKAAAWFATETGSVPSSKGGP